MSRIYVDGWELGIIHRYDKIHKFRVYIFSIGIGRNGTEKKKSFQQQRKIMNEWMENLLVRELRALSSVNLFFLLFLLHLLLILDRVFWWETSRTSMWSKLYSFTSRKFEFIVHWMIVDRKSFISQKKHKTQIFWSFQTDEVSCMEIDFG